MGLDVLDLVFRLERTFHVKIGLEEIVRLFDSSRSSDISVGALFELVRTKAIRTDAFDEDLDAEIMWLIFRKSISDALGVDLEEVTKAKWIFLDLGASSSAEQLDGVRSIPTRRASEGWGPRPSLARRVGIRGHLG
jgi:hypothetical protein